MKILIICLLLSTSIYAFPSVDDMEKNLMVSGAEVGVCMAKKSASDTLTKGVSAIGNLFGGKRRMLVDLSEFNNIMLWSFDPSSYVKDGLVKACAMAVTAVLETKLKAKMSADDWTKLGEPCVEEVAEQKCREQVDK